ncbi:MAG TPA: hypothetical protein VJV78_10325 [Polyangiales bacterium]|nr:hypothetical protein [Polyangiales bacterium]
MIASATGLGVLLRFLTFAHREAFWSDEAALGLNIVERGFGELGRPFLHAQVAPYLFLAGQKLVSLVAGTSEAALRSWSLVSGILLLPVLFALARRLGGGLCALIALAAAATGELLVYYSSELKPYGSDALWSALLLWFCVAALTAERAQRRRPLLRLAAAGVIGLWLSLPAVFILAASGVALAVTYVQERERSFREWALLAAVGGSWLLSFGLHYLGFLRMTPADADFMQRYWTALDGFVPRPLLSLHALHWLLAKFFYMFAVVVAAVGNGQRYIAGALWLFGLWLLAKRQRGLLCLFVLPIALLFVASAARAYVVADRLVLFLTPLLLIPCALALARIASLKPPVSRWAVLAVVAASCGAHVIADLDALRRPPLETDIRSLVAYLSERVDARDRLCVEDRVAWIYEYYAHRSGVWQPFVVVEALAEDPALPRAEIAKLAGAPRVWAVVPSLGPRGPLHAEGVAPILLAEQRILAALSELGHRLDMYDGSNVKLYLYDLSKK